jgi:hypothetical protein
MSAIVARSSISVKADFLEERHMVGDGVGVAENVARKIDHTQRQDIADYQCPEEYGGYFHGEKGRLNDSTATS